MRARRADERHQLSRMGANVSAQPPNDEGQPHPAWCTMHACRTTDCFAVHNDLCDTCGHGSTLHHSHGCRGTLLSPRSGLLVAERVECTCVEYVQSSITLST